MEKLKTSDDSRSTYDTETGAVRSFFGADLVEPPDAAKAAAHRSTGDATQDFLEANKDAFKLETVTLARGEERRGSATRAVTYLQQHNGIPVFGGKVVVGVEQASKRVSSAVNSVDYALPADLTPSAVRVAQDQVPEAVRRNLSEAFGHIKTGQPTLYIYRYAAVSPPETESAATRDKVEQAAALGQGEPGQAYLVWHVPTDTTEPSGNTPSRGPLFR
jgi:hypothetical protein